MTNMAKCAECGSVRDVDRDALDYSPMQVFYGAPLGWYSGPDGEKCGDCIGKAIGV